MQRDFQNKNILITGASRGIGLATAKVFAEKGARVIMVSRNAENLEAAAADIEGETITYTADVAGMDDIRHLVDFVKQKLDKLDVLDRKSVV